MKSPTRTNVAWLSSEAAAAHLGFATLKAFHRWREEAKPRTYRLGRRLRFRQVDLDACVEAEPQPVTTSLSIVRGANR